MISKISSRVGATRIFVVRPSGSVVTPTPTPTFTPTPTPTSTSVVYYYYYLRDCNQTHNKIGRSLTSGLAGITYSVGNSVCYEIVGLDLGPTFDYDLDTLTIVSNCGDVVCLTPTPTPTETSTPTPTETNTPTPTETSTSTSTPTPTSTPTVTPTPTATSTPTPTPTPTSSIYNVGDIGPGGGIVFYVQNNGLCGLEITQNSLGNYIWGCDDIFIGGISFYSVDGGSNIGRGQYNTTQIINNCNQSNIAAKICNDYSINEF